ncbi:MAG: 2-phospho-L-lactate guanylyltransferase [Rhizobiales bacterium]|nr:2-phospho-L-lactate guanylyltransferase [Hyphomicrobiales bacterium]
MIPAGVCAIVPVKRLDRAKHRLAARLTPPRRRRLVLAMLTDVLATLRQTPGIACVLVVTPDGEVADRARSAGAEIVLEAAESGLNPAIVRGLEVAAGRGWRHALVLPADVPAATPRDITTLLDAATSGDDLATVIAPASDGDGTNALLLHAPFVVAPAFGPASAERHAVTLRAAGPVRVLRNCGALGFDVDTPADLDRLLAEPRCGPRYRLLLDEEPGTVRAPHSPVMEIEW